MIGLLRNLLLPIAAAAVLATPGAAQQAASEPVTIEYYYKLVAGGTSEWLALYKKNHNPILREMMKEGLLKSERLYTRRFHAASPAWDYLVVMVWRDWAALGEASRREPEIIRSLYPDPVAHEREETRRWQLTEKHWDDVLKEQPLD